MVYSKGKNDECYTPAYGVYPILKHIEDFRDRREHTTGTLTVWCPFDTEDSEFVIQISKLPNVVVVSSHISNGQDYYEYEPDNWDIIVSNPPFSNKRQIFERALSFGKPFALLMINAWLNDKYSKWVFKEADKDMQLLMFDRRILYGQGSKITFSSSYYCCDLLSKQIIIEELPKENK
jgi:hypothetical protein